MARGCLENLCTLELSDLEHMALINVFGLTRGKVRGDWRKMHNEQLHDLYWSPNIIRVLK
jgi:hypothetical protein